MDHHYSIESAQSFKYIQDSGRTGRDLTHYTKYSGPDVSTPHPMEYGSLDC